ncbi:MAG: hypothetical protein OQL09_08750 [Gammaproteobacteria bacterium]|nr:hypothetical protein [Gammaproteobacteria bacterium]
MPHLDTTKDQNAIKLAIQAEALYLVNLLLLPGIGFILLILMYLRNATSGQALVRCHLKQTLNASIWAGILLVIINGLILLLGSYSEPWTWVVLIIYFTSIHATLVLLGVVGLSKAMAGRHYHYPIIGPRCTEQ